MHATPILPDLLAEGLDVVFIGTAPGRRSAELGAYYARPGNRFWPTLHAVGLTPRLFAPHEFCKLLALGIGLTDVCKTAFGSDHEIAQAAFDPAGLAAKMRRYRPRAMAFTSKKGASVFFARPTASIPYGLQSEAGEGLPPAFVLTSPSGAGRGHWSEAPWHALAAWLRAVPPR